jgi:hypothetical protein
MAEAQRYPYATHLDIKFAPLSVVDVPRLIAECRDGWYNQTLCRLNDSVIRLGAERAVVLMAETADIVPAGDS